MNTSCICAAHGTAVLNSRAPKAKYARKRTGILYLIVSLEQTKRKEEENAC